MLELYKVIATGYFPHELTPSFHTKSLADCLINILPDLNNIDDISKKRKKTSKCLPYSMPKINSLRRNLNIPNPLLQIRLANTIKENWDEIKHHSSKSNISLSKLQESSTDSEKALEHPQFDESINERILRSDHCKFLLKIDIARFYSSIYTHSIPWALHGKSTAKQHRDRNDLFGNALDEDSRRLQDGQTMGLPIGPDTSRIISEIILTAIDIELQNKLSYINGVRIVDDYYLYFKTLDDLNNGHSILQKLLRSYELELNPFKVKRIELPEVFEKEWIFSLKNHWFSNKLSRQRSDIISYFDKAFYFSRVFKDDHVLRYSISRLRKIVFKPENWNIFESLLLKTIIIEPKAIPYIAEMLVSYKNQGFPLNKAKIKTCIEDFIFEHARLENDFEVTWGLWLIKEFKIILEQHLIDTISKINHSIIALAILELNSEGLTHSMPDTSLWKSNLTKEGLYSDNWLLAYEAIIKGWITTTNNYVDDDPFFSILKNKKVEFYKKGEKLDLSNVKVNDMTFSLEQIVQS